MRSSRALRAGKRVASTALVLAVLGGWFHWFMPQKLGGRAGWVLVSGKSMLPHYRAGDLVLVERQSAYRVGEVVAYLVPKGDPMAGLQVIHRIVGGDAVHGFVTQGDNRTAPDVWRPKPQDVVGAEELRVPYGVVAINILRSPLMLAILAASFVFVYVFTRRREDEETEPTPKAA
jgi:signal peptidase I